MHRFVTGVAALLYAAAALLLTPALAHPSEVYLATSPCPSGHGWPDAIAYAAACVLVLLAVPAAVRLFRSLGNGGSPWLIAGSVVVVGLLLVGRGATLCASAGETTSGDTGRSVVLAAAAVAVVVAVLLRRRRTRE